MESPPFQATKQNFFFLMVENEMWATYLYKFVSMLEE